MDLTKNEYRDIVNIYGAELKSHILVNHDIGKELAIIEKKSSSK